MMNAPPHKKPSNLADILGKVKAMFDGCGDRTPILIGDQYLDANQGNPPRIVFDPEPGNGRIGPTIAMGHGVASWTHGCNVHVRSKPGASEEDTFANAYDLADRVIAALAVAGVGRTEFGAVVNDSPTKTNTMGAGLRFSFTFRREIPTWEKLWTLKGQVDDNTNLTHTPEELGAVTPPGPKSPTLPLVADGVNIIPTTIPEEE
jgi:hypothetical protein